MKILLISFINFIIIGSLIFYHPALTIANDLYDSKINIPIYILGDSRLENIAKQAGFYKIYTLNKLTTPTAGKGILVIGRMLNNNETIILIDILKEGFVTITINHTISEQTIPIISNIAIFTVNFNGTNIYAFKLLNMLKNKRYSIVIKGYAGELSPDVLRDSAKIMTIEGNWTTLGYISWSSQDSWKPYGRLNVEHTIYYANDIWSDMDLLAVRATTHIISGYKLGWSSNGLAWWNDNLKNMYYLTYYSGIYQLRDYDPSSMSNPSSISVSLTWLPGAILSWTYPGNYINYISDESDFSVDIAGWYHELTSWQWQYGTTETIKIEPGFEFTISPLITGTQRWSVTASWIAPQPPHGVPVYPFSGTVIIDVTFQY